jgi:hypothetical protein
MTNNNIADISAFEAIQSDQHAQMGISSMSVFNALKVKDIPSTLQKLDAAAKKALEARKVALRLYKELNEFRQTVSSAEFKEVLQSTNFDSTMNFADKAAAFSLHYSDV